MKVHKDFIMPEGNSIKKKVKVVEDTQRQESIYYKFMDSLQSMMAPIKWTKNVSRSKQVDDLWKRAEERIPKPEDSIDWISEIEVKKLKHELEVYQVELEMQNEALQKSQIELTESRRKYTDLYDFAPIGYFTFDRKGHIIEANVTGASLLGFEKRSLAGEPFHRFIMPGHFRSFQSHLQQALDMQSKQTCKLKLVKRDGSSFDAQIDTIAVTDGEGKFDQYQSSVIDITEQNLMEEKVRENEKKFFCAFHNAPVSMSISNLHEGRFLDVNEEFLHTSGRSSEEVIGQTSIDLNIWVDPERRKGFIETIQQKGRVQGYDARIRAKSGEVRDMLWSAELVELNKSPYLVASAVDITDRKRQEEFLQKSERRYSSLFETTQDSILILDQKTGNIIEANPAACMLYGYSKDEFLKMRHIDISAEPEKTSARLRDSVTSVPLTFHRKKDGTVFPVEISGSYYFEGDLQLHTAFIRDITGRKQLEEMLIKSENQYRNLVDNLPIGVYQVGIDGKFIFANQEFVRIMDYDSIEELMSLNVIHLYKNPQDRLVFLYTIRESGIIRNYEIEILTKRGVSKNILINGFIEGDHISGTVVDIVERKRAEEALREAHKQAEWLARFPDEDPNPVMRVSDEGSILYCNRVSAEIPEWSYEVGKQLADSLLPLLGQAITAGEEIQQHVEMGERFYSVAVVPIPGKSYANIYGRDITEHKRAEKALRESEERYRHLVEHAPAGIYKVDLTTRKFLSVNDVLCQYTGYTREECLSMDPIQLLTEESRKSFIQMHAKVLAGEPILNNTELQIKRKNGSEFWALLNVRYSYEPNNRILTTVIVYDITERKSMENALRKSEQHYRSLVESTNDSIYLLDRDLKYLFANTAYLSRVGLTLQQLIGRSYSELHPFSNDSFLECGNHVFETGEPVEFEYKSFRDNKPFLRTLSPVRGEQGETIAVTIVSKDVTHLKKIESTLREYHGQLRALMGRIQAAREEERVVIARDIHDELGGALTGLKIDLSYLAATLPKMRDTAKKNFFVNKLNNMKNLIDETVHTVRRIITDIRPSILDDFGLIAAIEWQAQEFQKRTGIECEFISALEDIRLDEQYSTAVFRIFQESLTNVVRHAAATKVTVRLHKEADHIILKVADNGKGITEEKISDTKSLGLLGMRERALLLGGTVNFSGEPWKGTTVSVCIPARGINAHVFCKNQNDSHADDTARGTDKPVQEDSSGYRVDRHPRMLDR